MTRWWYVLCALGVTAAACSTASTTSTETPAIEITRNEASDRDAIDEASAPDDGVEPVRSNVIRNYVFGHSLIVHAPPSQPAGPDETTVPHWLGRLSDAGGQTYLVDGQYGFLRTHAESEPRPQWGFAEVEGAWDVDAGQSFGDADFTTVLLTPANFIQGVAPTEPFEDDPGGPSPVDATLTIIDRAVAAEPGIEILVYENWPDLASVIGGDFPPPNDALADYHGHTATTFHEWWLDYHDALRAARPDVTIRLVPAGSTIAHLLQTEPWSNIDVSDLYEDDAPHGRPTIYLLAAAVTHAAMFGPELPAEVALSESIHPLVRENWSDVISAIRTHLETVVDAEGRSRVW